jgi:hypothetical protein
MELPTEEENNMRAEEKVSREYPASFYCRGFIYDKPGVGGTRIGMGEGEKAAWADAWRRIQAQKGKP